MRFDPLQTALEGSIGKVPCPKKRRDLVHRRCIGQTGQPIDGMSVAVVVSKYISYHSVQKDVDSYCSNYCRSKKDHS